MLAYSSVDSFCLRSPTVCERGTVTAYLDSEEDLTVKVICASLSSEAVVVGLSAMAGVGWERAGGGKRLCCTANEMVVWWLK